MKLAISILLAVLVASCANAPQTPNPDPTAQITATMGNTLIVTKRTVISTMTIVAEKCQRKLLDEYTCRKAEELYIKIQPAINAAEHGVIVAATTGDLAELNANQSAINGMVAELLELKGAE